TKVLVKLFQKLAGCRGAGLQWRPLRSRSTDRADRRDQRTCSLSAESETLYQPAGRDNLSK
ncbi:MAG: hypothetical protein IJU51_02875, partial [Clostridia bacterium]|nr:hypothetical protein [Clostridia bacterium]